MLKLNFKFKREQIIQGLVLLFLLLVGLGWAGITQLQTIRSDFLLVNNLMTKQSNKLEEITTEVKQLQQVNAEGLAKLEIELLAEKEKRVSDVEKQTKDKVLAQQQISDLKEKIAETEKNELTNIVNQWEPFVVALECNFYSPLAGDRLLQSNGSGLLTQRVGGAIAVLTNRHIITALALEKDDLANDCTIKFPQQNISLTSKNISVLEGGFDWGLVAIDFPNGYIKTLLQSSPQLCLKNPTLGDSVVILGYPSIGDQKNVTVTEGIIAGFDGDYFITSAKVEKGNSGGAAVSLENNCYLGTPTFSRTGEIESLARILDVRVLK